MRLSAALARAANGLEMRVTSGTATALGHSFELVGFTATVPFNGYWTLLEHTHELTLHVTDFDSDFQVHSDEPKIDGNFDVTGWITAIGSTSGKLVQEHVRAKALELDAAARPARTLTAAASAAGVLGILATMFAITLRWRSAAGAEPLQASDQQRSESVA
jgi:hypothetical protein